MVCTVRRAAVGEPLAKGLEIPSNLLKKLSKIVLVASKDEARTIMGQLVKR